MVSKNGLKCNIALITAQKLSQSDAIHILTHFHTKLRCFVTIFIQIYRSRMKLGSKNPFFGLKKWPKCIISLITAHKLPQSDAIHILTRFYRILQGFEKVFIQMYLSRMKLGGKYRFFGRRKGLNCSIPLITAQKFLPSYVKHILTHLSRKF